ncbi:hypothetical protein JCM8547_006653 [Rhodosporidiobolus lusitaniae]
MLPQPASSRSSSPMIPSLPSSPLLSPSSKLAISSLPAPLRPVALRLRAVHRSRPFLLPLSSLSLLFLLFLFFPRSAPPAHRPLAWGTHPDAILNYGDYVGLGQMRQKMLESTPKGYPDLGDKIPYLDRELGGPLYRKRRSRAERERGVEGMDLSDGAGEGEGRKEGGGGGKKSRKKGAEKERHGVLGGASLEWSTGVVGSGVYLGPVDMMKDSPSSRFFSPSETSPALSALSSHILAKGWVYLDASDQQNTEKLQLDARAKGYLSSLPLRERVRGDEEGMREAAEGWSKIYAAEAMEGGMLKSALEVQLERTVRRAPVVVFSKSTCPHSRRAKSLLSSLGLYPLPHIIEVDLRPDGKTLKSLLARKTGHSTFPNIIIGGRSIGGADDLEDAKEEAELKGMLEEVGVRWEGGL